MEEQTIKTDEEVDGVILANNGEGQSFDAESFKVKLNTFEGPLDLLLELIKSAKIDICDIFLSEITEQYLEIVSGIGELDVDKASEFIEMASTLLEIKSRKLLPKIPSELEVDEEDPEQKLIRQIEEYKLFKEASEKLQASEDVDKFYKEPDPKAGDFRYVLPEDLSINNLIEAFSKVMFKASMKAEVPKEKKIVKDRFTVAQKIGYIKDILLIKKNFSFKELFDDDYSKSEIINTFLAVLELLKTQEITVKQNNNFDDIEIRKKEEKA